jgi:hypothetical protein
VSRPGQCPKCGLLHGAERRCDYDVLREALVGVELTPYEDRILHWLAGWDQPTLDALLGIFRKLRAAGGP